MTRGPAIGLSLAIVVGFALPAVPAAGQIAAPFERPGDKPLEVPEPGPNPPAPDLTLPPPPPPAPTEGERLSRGPRSVVHEIRVSGSTVFDAEVLGERTAPYTGRAVSAEELLVLRDELTRLYVDAGYISSGVVLPDQDVSDGVVELQVVEGKLARIEIDGQDRFRERYLRDRIALGAKVPLSTTELEARLQILQQDPRIRRVDARLGPGSRLGEAELRVGFAEERPWHARFDVANDQPPSVGSWRTRFAGDHQNLTGNGDVLRLETAFTDGLGEVEVSYAYPITRHDTLLGARFRYSESDVVERPFDDFDIESRSKTIELFLEQPVYRSLRHRVEISLTAAYRRSETFLLGERESFSPGPEEGRSQIAVARFGQAWTYRDLHQVLAARSLLSVGLNAFDATTRRGSIPDGQFLAWLGQLQWVRRFDPSGIRVVARTDLQLATSALLSLEQFAIGGASTVRGYREHQLVRDNGWVASVETRIPLLSRPEGGLAVELVPFADIGRSWSTNREETKPRTLYSVGIGLRATLLRHLQLQVDWAEGLRDVARREEHDLQDSGLHLRLGFSY